MVRGVDLILILTFDPSNCDVKMENFCLHDNWSSVEFSYLVKMQEFYCFLTLFMGRWLRIYGFSFLLELFLKLEKNPISKSKFQFFKVKLVEKTRFLSKFSIQ